SPQMTITVHSFDTTNYDEVLGEYEAALVKRRKWLAEGHGDRQAICQQAVHFSIMGGCMLLTLGRADHEALKYFRQALAFGVIELGVPGTTTAPRVYDMLLELGEEGRRVVYEHERRPSREPTMLSVGDYSSILMMAVCFGERADMAEVARYPEERYRNPNVIA